MQSRLYHDSWNRNAIIILSFLDKRFEPRTVDQCFGQTIPIQCDPGFMVQVTKVFYRQSQQCHGSFHSNFCTREEASNPACVGNETCVFTTPYIYLSPECGYSNNFLVTYKCIPGLFVYGISLTLGQLIMSSFQTASRSCFLQVVLRRMGDDCIYEMKCLFVYNL